MKSKLLLTLLMTSVFTLAKDKKERRQNIVNNSAYPIKITLQQTGKLCKKEKDHFYL